MAFERQTPVTPVRVGNITVTLFDPDPAVAGVAQRATADITVVLSDGALKTVHANIPDHFSATVVNQLKAFMASVRTKAVAEIL